MKFMGEDEAMRLLRDHVEHAERLYLRTIGSGPGWPILTVADLGDEHGRACAEEAGGREWVAATLEDAAVRGVSAAMVSVEVLAGPYGECPGWWSGCPAGRYPIRVLTGGGEAVIARELPQGCDSALRKRLLAATVMDVIGAHREAMAAGAGHAVALVADLDDDLGATAAAATYGEDEIRKTLASATDPRKSRMLIWAGYPAAKSYPGDWGGFPEAGRIAVQVIAHGGISNFLVDSATAEVVDVA
jgi:hypothetical protein